MQGGNVTITAEISTNSYPGKSVLHSTVVTVTAQVSQSSYLRVHPCMVQLSHTITAEVSESSYPRGTSLQYSCHTITAKVTYPRSTSLHGTVVTHRVIADVA